MKVQLNRTNYPDNIAHNNQPAFKGTSGVLNYLATNLGIGANLTDVTFMVAPRTAKDGFCRGIDAGLETGFRESMGTVNDASIGLYGMGAGAVLGSAIAGNYGVKASKIFTSPERLETLANFWKAHIENKTSQKEYLMSIINEVEGYNTANNAETGFVKLTNQGDKEKVVNILDNVINNDKIDIKQWRSKCPERGVVNAIITESTGADTRFRLKNSGNSNLNTLLDDIVGMTKAFKEEKVMEAFNNATLNGEKNKFLSAMSKFNKGRALMGFLVGSGVGLAVQPINMWFTKKRTGKEGFVGGTCNEKDRSTKFKIEKAIVAAGMFSMVLASLKCKPKDFLNKMAFQGLAPTINQLKGVYGVTVTGRILVTRSEDEMWESARKDSLGFLSWLVLGDFVNRGVAAAFTGKRLLNFNKETDGNVITSSTLKSRSEVLREGLRSVGLSTVKTDSKTGMQKAMNITEMIKLLKTSPEAKPILKATMKKLKVLNIAQFAGYAFTGIALGLGIPTLNIYMTRRSEARRKAKLEAEQVAKNQAA